MPVSHRRAPRVARDTIVYTNAPIRRGEALIAHLCTLLRSQGHSQPKLTAQQCTQTPQSGTERPSSSICVHYCDPKATHNPSPQPNSVHKRPNPARRGPILPSVYTIAAMRSHPRHDSVHKRPNLASEGPCHPFVYTIVIPRPPTTQAHSPTVYTNAPIWRGEARSSHLCTLLRSQGHPQPKPTVQ